MTNNLSESDIKSTSTAGPWLGMSNLASNLGQIGQICDFLRSVSVHFVSDAKFGIPGSHETILVAGLISIIYPVLKPAWQCLGHIWQLWRSSRNSFHSPGCLACQSVITHLSLTQHWTLAQLHYTRRNGFHLQLSIAAVRERNSIFPEIMRILTPFERHSYLTLVNYLLETPRTWHDLVIGI